ncbi:DUF2891 domain-containing protein [Flavobacteriaceae bacterium S356]|uniref:DUF2891 domain-containing protein n=1 Tax=Asprobacillus argus TaxID=3076534 RepID=A0ABU3LFE7_9FLAO|nr:DUF2891 domain-containing protein [Flavobacteriaceae bacterium S356]
MKKLSFLCLLFLMIGCKPSSENQTKGSNNVAIVTIPKLDAIQADRLIQLPLHCVHTEYPNKLGQTIGSDADLRSPKELHPSFYGCFDWHSSVHGHWSLVALLKQYPNSTHAFEAKQKLKESITAENIAKEIVYFKGKYNGSYERTYGWAWLLKLAEELHTWNDPLGKELETNLQPLTNLIVEKYLEFLPKLKYPIRVGEHTNTAFGLTFAWDYANTVQREDLKSMIDQRAKDFYLKDADCPITWEPSGFDFLSPCLQEAAIMKRVLPASEFSIWLKAFLPKLSNEDFRFPVGEVSDRTDGKLVHLDGVNFSRAWCLYNIIEELPEYDHLKNLANEHINYSLPNLVGDSYEGGHWLGSFAIYALKSMDND